MVIATGCVPLLAHQTAVEVDTFLKVQESVLTVLAFCRQYFMDAGLDCEARSGAARNEGPLRAGMEAAKELEVMSGFADRR